MLDRDQKVNEAFKTLHTCRTHGPVEVINECIIAHDAGPCTRYRTFVHVHTSICVHAVVTKLVSFPLLLPRAPSSRFTGSFIRMFYYLLPPPETSPISRSMGYLKPAARLRRRKDIATPAPDMPTPWALQLRDLPGAEEMIVSAVLTLPIESHYAVGCISV